MMKVSSASKNFLAKVPKTQQARCFSIATPCRCGKMNCFMGCAVTSQARKMSTAAPTDPLEKILHNNREWVKETSKNDPDFFKKAGSVHKPKYLYIGCSDARVPANLILGLGPGEVFVHRNIGNQFPVNDLNAQSVVEYAVAHLGVTDILVAGHYECGAVRGASARQTLGQLDAWLRLIKDVYRLHKSELEKIKDENEFHRRLVELNVVEQCVNLYKTNVIQTKRYETFKTKDPEGVYPRIHPVVFNPLEGVLKSLNTDIKSRVAELDSVYGLKDEFPN